MIHAGLRGHARPEIGPLDIIMIMSNPIHQKGCSVEKRGRESIRNSLLTLLCERILEMSNCGFELVPAACVAKPNYVPIEHGQ